MTKDIWLSPKQYIKFKEDSEAYTELVEKLEPNVFSTLEALIKQINEDIANHQNIFDNIEKYKKEFHLESVFPPNLMYELEQGEFLKNFLATKGTEKAYNLLIKLFGLDYEHAHIDGSENDFIDNQNIDRDTLRDLHNCKVNLVIELNLDEWDGTGNYDIVDINGLRDLASYVLQACIFVARVMYYLLLEDTYEFDITDPSDRNGTDEIDVDVTDYLTDTYNTTSEIDEDLRVRIYDLKPIVYGEAGAQYGGEVVRDYDNLTYTLYPYGSNVGEPIAYGATAIDTVTEIELNDN